VGKGKELTLHDLGIGSSGKEPILEQERHEPGFPPIPPEGIDFPSVQESFEKYYIEQALKLAGGNESKAAKLLNMNHHTFRYHRKKLQIR
jgi:DNA-binding NtrC family response regulator